MKISLSPEDLLEVYEMLIRDSYRDAKSLNANALYQKIRLEIMKCLEKEHDEKSAKEFKIWNEKELKKIEELEKTNNDVKLTSDMVKKFSEVSSPS